MSDIDIKVYEELRADYDLLLSTAGSLSDELQIAIDITYKMHEMSSLVVKALNDIKIHLEQIPENDGHKVKELRHLFRGIINDALLELKKLDA